MFFWSKHCKKIRIKGVVHKLAQSTGHEEYCTACKVLRLLVQLWWPGSLFCIPDLSESCLSVTVSRLMWSAEVASLQTWSVLMHSPRPGNAEVMIYFPAMKETCQQALGHFLPKAGGNPPVGKASKQTKQIYLNTYKAEPTVVSYTTLNCLKNEILRKTLKVSFILYWVYE